VRPPSGSNIGISPSRHVNLKHLTMLANRSKFSILARFSPRHFLLPNPNGMSLSSETYLLLEINLQGLNTFGSLILFIHMSGVVVCHQHTSCRDLKIFIFKCFLDISRRSDTTNITKSPDFIDGGLCQRNFILVS